MSLVLREEMSLRRHDKPPPPSVTDGIAHGVALNSVVFFRKKTKIANVTLKVILEGSGMGTFTSQCRIS